MLGSVGLETSRARMGALAKMTGVELLTLMNEDPGATVCAWRRTNGRVQLMCSRTVDDALPSEP